MIVFVDASLLDEVWLLAAFAHGFGWVIYRWVITDEEVNTKKCSKVSDALSKGVGSRLLGDSRWCRV